MKTPIILVVVLLISVFLSGCSFKSQLDVQVQPYLGKTAPVHIQLGESEQLERASSMNKRVGKIASLTKDVIAESKAVVANELNLKGLKINVIKEKVADDEFVIQSAFTGSENDLSNIRIATTNAVHGVPVVITDKKVVEVKGSIMVVAPSDFNLLRDENDVPYYTDSAHQSFRIVILTSLPSDGITKKVNIAINVWLTLNLLNDSLSEDVQKETEVVYDMARDLAEATLDENKIEQSDLRNSYATLLHSYNEFLSEFTGQSSFEVEWDDAIIEVKWGDATGKEFYSECVKSEGLGGIGVKGLALLGKVNEAKDYATILNSSVAFGGFDTVDPNLKIISKPQNVVHWGRSVSGVNINSVGKAQYVIVRESLTSYRIKEAHVDPKAVVGLQGDIVELGVDVLGKVAKMAASAYGIPIPDLNTGQGTDKATRAGFVYPSQIDMLEKRLADAKNGLRKALEALKMTDDDAEAKAEGVLSAYAAQVEAIRNESERLLGESFAENAAQKRKDGASEDTADEIKLATDEAIVKAYLARKKADEARELAEKANQKAIIARLQAANTLLQAIGSPHDLAKKKIAEEAEKEAQFAEKEAGLAEKEAQFAEKEANLAEKEAE